MQEPPFQVTTGELPDHQTLEDTGPGEDVGSSPLPRETPEEDRHDRDHPHQPPPRDVTPGEPHDPVLLRSTGPISIHLVCLPAGPPGSPRTGCPFTAQGHW